MTTLGLPVLGAFFVKTNIFPCLFQKNLLSLPSVRGEIRTNNAFAIISRSAKKPRKLTLV